MAKHNAPAPAPAPTVAPTTAPAGTLPVAPTTAPAGTLPVAPAVAPAGTLPTAPAGTLPVAYAAVVPAAKGSGKGVTMLAQPGALYGVTVPVGNGTVTLPWRVPGWACNGTGPVLAKVCNANNNWLGRNGAPLRATVFASPAGCVVVQPTATGVTVHAFTPGHLAIVAMPTA